MDGYMFGFIALDEILGHFPRSMMHVTLNCRVGNDLLDNDSADPASLGIPSNMITDLEWSRRRGHPFPPPFERPDQANLDILRNQLCIEHTPVFVPSE